MGGKEKGGMSGAGGVSASDESSERLTYEAIVESFVTNNAFKCDYNECDKRFSSQQRLDSHKQRRHVSSTSQQPERPLRAPGVREHPVSGNPPQSKRRKQSHSEDIPALNISKTTSQEPTISTTTSLDNTCHNSDIQDISEDTDCVVNSDSDSDIEVMIEIPALNAQEDRSGIVSDDCIQVPDPSQHTTNNTQNTEPFDPRLRNRSTPSSTANWFVVQNNCDLSTGETSDANIPACDLLGCKWTFKHNHKQTDNTRDKSTDNPDITVVKTETTTHTSTKYIHLKATDRPMPLPSPTKLDSDSKSYTCDMPDCGKQFTSNFVLIQHKYVVHKIPDAYYISNTTPTVPWPSYPSSALNTTPTATPTSTQLWPNTCNSSSNSYIPVRDPRQQTSVFSTNDALNEHRMAVHMKPNHIQPYVCNICNEGFTREVAYDRHKHTAHTGVPHNPFPIPEYFQKNKKVAPQDMAFVCDIPDCGKRFINGHILKTHRRLDHKVGSGYICLRIDCTKVFETKLELQTHHRKDHKQLMDFVCDVGGCGQRFFNGQQLMDHKLNHHQVVCTQPPVGGIGFRCDCGVVLTTQQELDGHQILDHYRARAHTPAPPRPLTRHVNLNEVKCDKCGKSFKTQTALNSHTLDVHKGSKDDSNELVWHL
ncbi:unnamed protein product [Oppiella nova]|uniref:C2H2-type domain-containing protein n=1 Tax=Oppiella nova TaxID=334625 RepID=A0A7R9M2N6_9ACAR|nr:unnamed protein product [Oppiella nova]CAG2169588.1 unnamed protein product [Oppiella nova]